MKNRFTEEEIKFLVNEYPNVGLYETCRFLDRTPWSIEAKVRSLGIRSRVRSKRNKETKENKCIDQTYYNVLEGYNKGYILGFIFSDGSFDGKSKTIIEIHKNDIEVLEFIKKELKLTCSILFRKSRPMCCINIPTESFSKKLVELGLHRNKSKTIKLPNIKDKEFMRGFICGYFDGDGCIFSRKDRKCSVMISITSNSLSMLEEIEIYIFNIIGELACLSRNKLVYYNRKATKLGTWMYSDNDFHMSRKKSRFYEIINRIQFLKRRVRTKSKDEIVRECIKKERYFGESTKL